MPRRTELTRVLLAVASCLSLAACAAGGAPKASSAGGSGGDAAPSAGTAGGRAGGAGSGGATGVAGDGALAGTSGVAGSGVAGGDGAPGPGGASGSADAASPGSVSDAATESPPDGGSPRRSRYVFSVSGTKTYLNGQPLQVKGIRCSNALLSDQTASDLIASLDAYESYGMNTVSVYVMGSRYGNIAGYRQDASLDPTYAARLGRIVEAADARGMVVLVGCLYWGTTTGKWADWTQQDADAAIANTTRWAKDNDYRNVFFDPDNEGMAVVGSKNIKSTAELVEAGKKGDPAAVMASNYGPCPAAADLAIHLSQKDPTKPYIQTEGFGIWKYGSTNYDPATIGVYTAAEEQSCLTETQGAYAAGEGWMLSSMWLQAPPPYGPETDLGGDGVTSPGVRWWADWLKSKYGPYVPPAPRP